MNHDRTGIMLDAPPQTSGMHDGLDPPRLHWALAAIWLAMAMAVLDGVIANLALPTIAQELAVSPAVAVWVINIYQLAIIALLLPFAAAGEILGYRQVYLFGVALFAVGSLGCSLSTGLTGLVAWRFIQGIGAAALMAVNGALIRLSLSADALGRGLSYNAIIVSIASGVGPTVAAAILAAASWRWLFAINIPVAMLVLAAGARSLPESPRATRRFDWVASVSNALFFGASFLVATDIVAGDLGPGTWISLLVAPVTAFALVRRESAKAEPLIPIDLFRMVALRRSYLASVMSFAGQMAGLVALPFYLHRTFGQFMIGLVVTGYPLGVAMGAPLSARLSERGGSGRAGACGLLLFALAYGLLSVVGVSLPMVLAACLVCAGFGMGLFQTPNNQKMMSSAPRSRSGAAAGMMAVCRMLGQSLGAILAALCFRLVGPASILPLALACLLGIVAAFAAWRCARIGSDTI